MGILGVELPLDEVELVVAFGTHLTIAWDSSSTESMYH